jgi:hypothetical protein
MRFMMNGIVLLTCLSLVARSREGTSLPKAICSKVSVAVVAKHEHLFDLRIHRGQKLTDIEQAVLDRMVLLMKGDVTKASMTRCRDEVCDLFAKDTAYKSAEHALRALEDLAPSLRLVGELNSILKLLPPLLQQEVTRAFWNLPIRQRLYLFKVFLKRAAGEIFTFRLLEYQF